MQWWSRGGHTNATNLIPACERIHHGIHQGGWQVTRETNGTVVWTSPTGHEYRVPPATYPVDNTTKIKKDTPDEGDEEKGSRSADDESPTI